MLLICTISNMISMLKEKVYSMKITDLNLVRERITSQCAEIDGNADQFHRFFFSEIFQIPLAKRLRSSISPYQPK